MKDNNENLNNELNDDEMEAVAGGAAKDWGWLQKRRFKSWMKKHGLEGDELKEKFESNIRDFSPASLKDYARRKGILDDELNKILS